MMTIVLCGGGSGGHITPLLAVASEFRKKHKNIKLVYIGEKRGKFAHIVENSDLFDEKHYITAGKLRRYHGESWLDKLLDVKTLFLNLRDIIFMLIGTIESYFLLKKLRASSLLLKGGYVCVPVAFAAKARGLPYVTHDSDALPGLSNRIAARWAKYHATGMPAKYYSYPRESVRFVGIPTDNRFRSYSPSEVRILKEKYQVEDDEQVLLITGGSNGARRLNEAVLNALPKLLRSYPNLYVMHQIGAGNEDQIEDVPTEVQEKVHFFDFSPEIFHMSAIADVIVTRAGASAIADYASQSKACILVPNPFLTGGHQLKNAEAYEEANTALVVKEDDLKNDSKALLSAIEELLKDDSKRGRLGKNLHTFNPSKKAASSLAELVYEARLK